MCRNNDIKREKYNTDISKLREEYLEEYYKIAEIKIAKEEVNILVNKAQCAINNLSDCDFGSNDIISSAQISQKGYYKKLDYYDEYESKCETAMKEIDIEFEKLVNLRNSLPKNCGYCSECTAQLKNFEQ